MTIQPLYSLYPDLYAMEMMFKVLNNADVSKCVYPSEKEYRERSANFMIDCDRDPKNAVLFCAWNVMVALFDDD